MGSLSHGIHTFCFLPFNSVPWFKKILSAPMPVSILQESRARVLKQRSRAVQELLEEKDFYLVKPVSAWARYRRHERGEVHLAAYQDIQITVDRVSFRLAQVCACSLCLPPFPVPQRAALSACLLSQLSCATWHPWKKLPQDTVIQRFPSSYGASPLLLVLQEQYRSILLFVESARQWSTLLQHVALRPQGPVVGNASLWWRYAILAVLVRLGRLK